MSTFSRKRGHSWKSYLGSFLKTAMPESKCHANLVYQLVEWVAETYLGGNTGGVLWDSAGTTHAEAPPQVGGRRPDAYAVVPEDQLLILGEAKSPWDLENRHTIAQLLAFLTHCRQHGKAVFVLAVPWHRVPLASNMIRNLKQRYSLESVEVIVLEHLPG